MHFYGWTSSVSAQVALFLAGLGLSVVVGLVWNRWTTRKRDQGVAR
ncbi:hypothetical protein [Burkholderia pseudomallei]|nr:hypothetical protein [Burkholderia pseudomallei]CAJ3077829.1 Uncharacterised protein [Burkholderia pseudomallei]VCK72424.1 Uncharacterised protein [Burkholderia pseudomallei]VCK79815.1 Uncharacterised protein [Burkholderia pseudomallei]VCK80189.1 Uncharacterised protein [Burkholderia pseudomallei]VCK80633.1 Uncharacterised protein [Burkholderia pseudomallei]